MKHSKYFIKVQDLKELSWARSIAQLIQPLSGMHMAPSSIPGIWGRESMYGGGGQREREERRKNEPERWASE